METYIGGAISMMGLFIAIELMSVCDGNACGQSQSLKDATEYFKLRKRAVVGSNTGKPGYWPWMAAVGSHDSNKNITWFCGGSLINEVYVLSAAHCFITRKPTVIRLGEVDLSSDTEGAEPEDFGISSVQLHSGYKRPFSYNDLALVKLDRTAKMSFFIQPVCLPKPDTSESYEGFGATLTGWGKTAFSGTTSPVLRQVLVTIVPNLQCNQNYQSVRTSRYSLPYGIINEQLCAGYEYGGNDACQGDSGGPLVRYDFNQKRHILLGVISSGTGCGSRIFPGLYTRVTEYVKWISQNVKNLPDSPAKIRIPDGTENIIPLVPTHADFNSVCGRRLPVHPGDIVGHGVSSSLDRIKRDLSHELESSEEIGQDWSHATSRQKRVVGGGDTLPAAWPWMAVIGVIEESTGGVTWTCGGALLNEYFVLSAATCFGTLFTSQYIVRLGERDLEQLADGASYEDFRVFDVKFHPEYRHHMWYNNLALLELERRVEFTRFIMPICLPFEGQETVGGENVTVTGWGGQFFGGSSVSLLQEATVSVMSSEECEQRCSSLQAKVRQNVIPEGYIPSMLCAQGLNGKTDICQGDTGSPLVQYNTVLNQYMLLAIASATYGCGSTDFPGIYTKVTDFLPWIHQHIRTKTFHDVGLGIDELSFPTVPPNEPGLFPDEEEVSRPADVLSNFFESNRPSSFNTRPRPRPTTRPLQTTRPPQTARPPFLTRPPFFPATRPTSTTTRLPWLRPTSTVPTVTLEEQQEKVKACGVSLFNRKVSSEGSDQWKNSKAGDFPWMVAVGEKQESGGIHWFCGGTLISDSFVISAGHCFYRRNGDVVQVESVDLTSSNDDNSFNIFDVKKVIVHPKFQLPSLYHDIALLQLQFHVPYKDFVQNVCLPPLHFQSAIFPDLSSEAGEDFVSGWEKQGEGGLQVLQHKKVHLLSNENCSVLLGSEESDEAQDLFYSQGLTPTVICADSGEICPGNNGGAIVRFNEENLIWTLIGVTSGWVNCGSGFPGLYTNVLQYSDWIQNEMDSLSSIPDYTFDYNFDDYI